MYPQEFLQSHFGIWTNQEIMEMPQSEKDEIEMLQSWFNPFEEPHKIDEIRQEIKLSPSKWKMHCEEEWPGIDIEKQHQIRKEECRQERIKNCGQWWYRKDPHRPGVSIKSQQFCNQRECKECQARKAKGIAKDLESCIGKRLILVNSEQEELIKNALSKADYRRIPDDETGNTYFVINKDQELEIEVLAEAILTDRLTEQLGRCAAESRRRISGNLEHKPKLEPKSPADDSQQVEQITLRTYTLDFEESTLQTYADIDRIVLEEFKFLDGKRDIDHLQYVIFQLEEKTKEVAERHCVEIHFINNKLYDVYIEKVDWSLLEKMPD